MAIPSASQHVIIIHFHATSCSLCWHFTHLSLFDSNVHSHESSRHWSARHASTCTIITQCLSHQAVQSPHSACLIKLYNYHTVHVTSSCTIITQCLSHQAVQSSHSACHIKLYNYHTVPVSSSCTIITQCLSRQAVQLSHNACQIKLYNHHTMPVTSSCTITTQCL